jgi:hypothetical protein
MVNQLNISEDVVKQYIKDKLDGKSPTSPFPADFQEPNIPTKEEFDQKVKAKIPSDAEIDNLVAQKIMGKIPFVPNIHFIAPSLKFNSKTNILIDPFINFAKIHLLSRGGTMMVMAQYPPPAPPAPGILMWQGYNVRNGPPIPPMLPKFGIPMGLGKFLNPEKGAKLPEDAQKELEDKLNPPQPITIGNVTLLPTTGLILPTTLSGARIVNIPLPSNTNTISITGGQTINDKTNAQNNINNNKC